MDSTSVPKPVDDAWLNLNPEIKGMKIGIPMEYRRPELDPVITAAWDEALKKLSSAGAEIVEVSLPHTEYAIATYYILTTAEASSNLARFDGIRYGLRVDGNDPYTLNSRSREAGFGPEVKRRIILGTYVLSSGYCDAYYIKAQKVRTLIRQDFERAFGSVDAIITPTTPTPAFRVGQKSKDPLEMYLSDIFTISSNLAGNCGISVPCGFTDNPRLPLGLQIIGPAFREDTVLNIAHAYQQMTDWHLQFPEL
jgi:aspartyl-tRNA(Asn)/glutamyl-tRNA(Gln) amidotransferase subunit A